MANRKKVSDQEYENAYKNRDNRKVIDSVTSRFRKVIDRDDLQSAGDMALLRCLEYHDDSYNQKFTTSLWRFTDWECKRVLRSKKNKLSAMQLSTIEVELPQNEGNKESEYVNEYIELLPIENRKILQQYYYQGMTMEEIGKANGYSKEAARQKINKSLKKLTEILQREK